MKKTEQKGYWLLKSEPDTFGIDHLKAEGITVWSGVRNYQARNNIRAMKKGDLCLFYHSSAPKNEIGISGLAKIVREAYPDPTATDKKSPYYEPNSKIEWSVVDVKFVKKFKRLMTLAEIKLDPGLANMIVCQQGSRLSVQPVLERDFEYIVKSLS